MLTRTPQAGYPGTSAAIRDADFTEEAKRIAVPTLCMVGAEDGATPPALVRELADLIPGARYEVIEGAGHLPCIERPVAVARLIEGFVKENGLRSEEHTSELQSLMRISYAVFCLKKKKHN